MIAITRSAVLSALARHLGQRNGVHIGPLVYEITGAAPDVAAERAVRKVIEELRREGEHICGHPASGYYMAETSAELDGTCKFLLSRAMTSLTQISRMKKIALPDLEGQLHLKT